MYLPKVSIPSTNQSIVVIQQRKVNLNLRCLSLFPSFATFDDLSNKMDCSIHCFHAPFNFSISPQNHSLLSRKFVWKKLSHHQRALEQGHYGMILPPRWGWHFPIHTTYFSLRHSAALCFIPQAVPFCFGLALANQRKHWSSTV